MGLVYLFLELVGHSGAYGELVSCYSWEEGLEVKLREKWGRAGWETVVLSDVCLEVRFLKDDILLKGVEWGSRWVIYLSGSSVNDERVLKLLCDEFVSGDMLFSFASFSVYMRMGVFSMDATANVRVMFLFTHVVNKGGEMSLLFGSAERCLISWGCLSEIEWVSRGDENRVWHDKYIYIIWSHFLRNCFRMRLYIVC